MGLGVPIPTGRRFRDTVLAGQTKDIKLGDFDSLRYGEILAHFDISGTGKRTDKITLTETFSDVEDVNSHRLGDNLQISSKVKKIGAEVFLEITNSEAADVSVFLTLTS